MRNLLICAILVSFLLLPMQKDRSFLWTNGLFVELEPHYIYRKFAVNPSCEESGIRQTAGHYLYIATFA